LWPGGRYIKMKRGKRCEKPMVSSESDLQLVGCPHLCWFTGAQTLRGTGFLIALSVSKRPKWSSWVHGYWL
jgi:hypothetical protein